MGKAKQAKKAARAEHALTGDAARKHASPPIAMLGAASEVADQPPLMAMSIATLATGAVLRNRTMLRTGARMLIAHALATGAKTVLKRSVDRARPARALQDGAPQVSKGKGSGDHTLNSFPSGHTAGAVGVAEAIAHEIPGAGAPARAGAAAVAAVQLPRGAHYLSDVAAGAAIGWLADRVAGAILAVGDRGIAARHERLALEEAEAHPS